MDQTEQKACIMARELQSYKLFHTNLDLEINLVGHTATLHLLFSKFQTKMNKGWKMLPVTSFPKYLGLTGIGQGGGYRSDHVNLQHLAIHDICHKVLPSL